MEGSERSRISLALRVGLLSLLLLAAGLGIATYGVRQVAEALREEAVAWGRSIASSLVTSLNDSIESNQEVGSGVLNKLVRMPGLAYVEVVDSAGAVTARAFAGAGWEERGGPPPGFVAKRVKEGGRAAYIDVPVELRRGFTLHIGLDRDSIESRVRPVRRAIVALVLVESMLAILLVVWASRPFIDGLRRAERKYRSIFEHTLEGIFQTTPDGQYISANPALARIYGYDSPAELIRGFSDIARQLYVLPGRREEFRELLAREGQVRNFESQVRRKDSSVIWISENARAVYDERGALSYYEGTVEDISERKQIERMKNEFISIVSHELRTPLTSIRGSLGLIAGGVVGSLPDGVKQMIDIAVNNTDRLVRLINDILDIEKIEAGKMPFQVKPVDLMALIDQTLESTRGFGDNYKVRLELTDRLPGARVSVDPDRLAQVLTNLLSNAVKFSAAGGSVRVAVRSHPKGVRISVTDHGPGIPEAFRARIFQKFAQADSSDTRQKEGTGLGLSICKAIVDRLQGEIGFETELGKGTTFHVDLPAVAKTPEVPVGVDTGKRRVLICEDDVDIGRLLQLMLAQSGCETDVAHSAAEAKEFLAQGRYEAMTLDLMLPGQDGISLIRELRSREDTAELPIVVVSVKAQDGKREINGDALGVIDWISKPIDPGRLQNALARATRKEKGGHLSILHVEDDPDNFRVVQSILGSTAEVSWAANLATARESLKDRVFDLVILDLGLPDGSGWDLVPLIKSRLGPSVPVVIFSANEITGQEAQEAAASLVKARTSNEQLLATIQSVLGGGHPRS